MSRSALVTGGAGFVGSHLVERLVALDWSVMVLDDLSTGRRENLGARVEGSAIRFVAGSVLDAATVEPLVGEADVVFHLAAAVGVDLVVERPLEALTTNVLGTQVVLDAAGRHGVRTLVASSSEIYGKSETVPYSEDHDRLLGPPTSVRWGYSTSKAVGECLALAWHREHGLPVSVARLFNTIGPRQRGRYGMVVPRFVAAARSGDTLEVHGDGRQRRCFCDVRDVVLALVDLATSQAAVGEIFNVGSDEEISIHDLAFEVLRLAGVDEARAADRIRLVPPRRAHGLAVEDMRRRQPDVSKVRSAIGWRPRIPLEQTLRELLAAAG